MNSNHLRKLFFLFVVPLLLAAGCAPLPLPWAVPRPDALDKPPEVTASLTLAPSSTPEMSCISDWSLLPTPQYDSPLNIPAPVSPLDLPDEVRVLALLGTDRNAPFVGRTDAVLLVLYHPRLARVSLLSLPPDLFVYIPGYTMQRLQSAYPAGGIDLFARAIEYNLGICLDDYMLVHLDDFIDFIDELGGLYVDVLKGDPKACGGIQPGHVHMDGEELLCYLSFRIGDGELDRNLRQQEVLRLIFQRLTQSGSLTLLSEWIDTYLPRVETSLQTGDMLEAIPLALRAADGSRIGFFRMAPGDLIPYQIPGEVDAPVFVPDRDGLLEVLRDAVEFVGQAQPPSELVLTLQYALTTSPTTTNTPTPTITGTSTVTPTRTLTPVRLPTNTRTLANTRTLGPSGTPTPTRTSTQPPPARIAYSADENGDGFEDVLTMLPNGGSVQVIVQTSQDARVSDWSSSANRLVLGMGGQLSLVNPVGGDPELVANQPAGINSQAAWSPDGEWLVFRSDNGTPDLYLIRADGSDLRQVTEGAADDWDPDWSPDGEAVIFVSDRDGSPDIYLVDVTGLLEPAPVPVPSLPVTRLTNTASAESWVRFSPDGSQILFARLDADWNIYAGEAGDLSTPTLLHGEAGNDQMPAWSANGSVILFVKDGEIYRMDADGSSPALIPNATVDEFSPIWQP